jgi:hypothetical protein
MTKILNVYMDWVNIAALTRVIASNEKESTQSHKAITNAASLRWRTDVSRRDFAFNRLNVMPVNVEAITLHRAPIFAHPRSGL